MYGLYSRAAFDGARTVCPIHIYFDKLFTVYVQDWLISVVYDFNFRYAQSNSQSQTQPRLPQPVPSDSSISSRDWNQRQERSMPGNQQNYEQPMQNFAQNYGHPPRGFNNDQRGKYVM